MGAIDTIRFRAATMEDVPALHALIDASVRGLQTNDYTAAEIEGAVGHALGLDKQLVADGTYFVAEAEDGFLAGCGGWSYRTTLCGGDQLAGREPASLDPAADAAKIRGIYVHPSWARMGLGSLILAYCEGKAKEAGFTRLEMGSTLTGVPLYRLRGYRETERMALPLPNGEGLAVVRMVKSI
jgi:GNAT superfamily N-acetyltransferase